jgi:hypothetical protein
MVIMRQNLHALPDIVRFAHRWSFKSIFAQHLCHDFAESSLPSHYIPMRDFVQAETLLGQEFRDRLSSEEPPEICQSCSIYRGTF